MNKLIKKYQSPSNPINTSKPTLDKIKIREDGSAYWKDQYGNEWPLEQISDSEYIARDTEENIAHKFNIDPNVVAKLKPYDAKDLDEFFANLLTFGAANELTEGAKHIDKGEYLDALKNYANIAIFGPGALGNVIRAGYGAYNLLNEDGVQKTVGLALGTRDDGLTGNRAADVALSLGGDLINGLLTWSGGKPTYISVENALAKITKNNTLRARVLSRELNQMFKESPNGEMIPDTRVADPIQQPRRKIKLDRNYMLKPEYIYDDTPVEIYDVNPHNITVSYPTRTRVPEYDLSYSNKTPVTYKSLGDKTSPNAKLNLSYNMQRYLYWAPPKIKELGMGYIKTGDLTPIKQYYKAATPTERQWLSNFVRQLSFVNSNKPYSYYSNVKLIKDREFYRELDKLKERERKLVGTSPFHFSGEKNMFIVSKNNNPRVIGHEGNHMFQAIFKQPEDMRVVMERALPSRNIKNGKRVTGNYKKEVGSEFSNKERGSTIHEIREDIINEFYNKTGRTPTFRELEKEIRSRSKDDLLRRIKNVNGYGYDYFYGIVDQITKGTYNFDDLYTALIYGYKSGGKLNNSKELKYDNKPKI